MISRVRGLILCILLAGIPGLEAGDQARAQAPAPIPQTAEIFVVNRSDSVMAYAPHRIGNVAPDWVMGRQLTPYGIARDSAGKIYVTNYWLDSISVFASGATGAASPVATIRGSKTGLEFPTGIAVDSKGKIYVVNGPATRARLPEPMPRSASMSTLQGATVTSHRSLLSRDLTRGSRIRWP